MRLIAFFIRLGTVSLSLLLLLVLQISDTTLFKSSSIRVSNVRYGGISLSKYRIASWICFPSSFNFSTAIFFFSRNVSFMRRFTLLRFTARLNRFLETLTRSDISGISGTETTAYTALRGNTAQDLPSENRRADCICGAEISPGQSVPTG